MTKERLVIPVTAEQIERLWELRAHPVAEIIASYETVRAESVELDMPLYKPRTARSRVRA